MEVKEKIKHLFKDGITKPNHIISHLRDAGAEIPSKVQLNNYLSTLRKTQGPPILSLGQLCELCDENEAIPSDQDHPFFVGKKIHYEDKTFQCISPAKQQTQSAEEIDRTLGLIKRMSWKKFDSYSTSKSKLRIIDFHL
ncbi:hypothetical protein Fcan01_18234 [Folsomia candida]|uniref:Uncharacterized protein n=1 Tax=Folsomia candida TaxID=158441 RepID=A0A226DNL6_FOLCA|nr:hypothetical protein Fcan01_18234 [Folsomia candida]